MGIILILLGLCAFVGFGIAAIGLLIFWVIQKVRGGTFSWKWFVGSAVISIASLFLMYYGDSLDDKKVVADESNEEVYTQTSYEETDDSTDDVESEEDDQYDIEYGINTTINDFVEENFQFDTVATEIEVNENLGTDKKDDYITLVHMDMPKVLSVEKGYGWIEKYSNYLASEMAEKEPDVSELVIFWTMAGSENNVAKYVLHREKDKFIFDSQWQDPNFKD